MSRMRWVWSAALVLACGCARGPAIEPPPSHDVKGRVTVDGKPLADGEITFEIVGQVPSILEVKGGAFAGQACEGKNTVQIRAYRAGPPLDTDPGGPPTKVNYLPARYSDESTLTAEVKPAANDFSFAIKSN
ncbi:MAG: hypothetical protein IT429_19075 [Gemmataceae bacterium]|nr:hypothetical protein [Gemmataceae bacterium]